MNKIYRVIWSKVKNCYVVVSEIAKAHSKGSSAVRRVPRMGAVLTTMLLASVLSFGISAPVWADDPVTSVIISGYAGDDTLVATTLATIQAGDGIGVTSQNGIITISAEINDIHFYSVNSNDTTAGNYNNNGATGRNAIAAGVNASATKENAIAIGTGAAATGKDSIAIGSGASAEGEGAIALGNQGAKATGEGSMAWGSGTAGSKALTTAWGHGVATGVRAT